MKEIHMGFAFGIVMMPDNLSFGDEDYFELGSSGFTASRIGGGKRGKACLRAMSAIMFLIGLSLLKLDFNLGVCRDRLFR